MKIIKKILEISKALISKNYPEKWMLFLERKRTCKGKGDYLDRLFVKDYKDVYKIFHRVKEDK